MPFPTYDAFGGFANSVLPFSKRRKKLPGPVDLDTLNTGVTRIIDVYAADYASVVRDNPAPLATLNDSQKNTEVAIVGAGMAGLCALYELTRCGLKPTIFEASGRLGGRCYTEHYSGPATGADPAEMGAMRFPDTAKLMWHYFKKTVEKTENPNPVFQPFPNPGIVATALNVEGNTSCWISDPSSEDFGLPPRVNKLGVEFDDVFLMETTVEVAPQVYWGLHEAAAALKKAILSSHEEEYLFSYWTAIINKFDHVSVEMFVRTKLQGPDAQANWTESDVRLFKAVGFGTGGMGQDFPTSMVDFIRYDLWDYEALYRWGPDYTSTGFAESFFKLSLEEGLPRENLIKSAAFDIHRSLLESNKIGVRYVDPDTNEVTLKLFDYVIIATSNPAMMQPMLLDSGDSSIYPASRAQRPFGYIASDLQAPLTLYTKQIRESIRNVEFYPSTKIWAATHGDYLKSPEWPKVEGADGVKHPVRWIVTDRQLGQTAIFPNEDGSKCSVLLTYQNGIDALRYHPLPLPIPQPPSVVSKIQYALATNQLTLSYVGMSSNNPGTTPLNEFGDILNNKFLESGIPGENTFKIEWHNEAYFQGAFRLLLAGQYNYNAVLAFQYTVASPSRYMENGTEVIPEAYRRVFLAGESAFFLDGWIEGPLYSGVNAATAVLHSIQGVGGDLRTSKFLDPTYVWRFRNNAQTNSVDFWNDSME
ncbi:MULTISPECIES: FAD-dependent oxidoreductase [unclassified Pseudomonas]|uniref:flavin monoamine oxidase family protein n=1 Tax=unclassified Pseudomonas TaxID=196821 RepID=UPI001032E431|nr:MULTISPECIES: FAD-dependent oxidoreductase [unclassified Pseudomonas]